MSRKPIWTEGVYISQHHLQQQDRYHEGLLRERLAPIVHFDWGVVELGIDETALGANQFKLSAFRAVWPDGTVISGAGGKDAPPCPLARSSRHSHRTRRVSRCSSGCPTRPTMRPM